MSTQEEIVKFDNLAEEVKKRSILVAELKSQNEAYEKGNTLLEGAKSILLEEIKVLKEAKRALSISRSKLKKGLEVDTQIAHTLSGDIGKSEAVRGELAEEIKNFGIEKEELIKENKELKELNATETDEMESRIALTEETAKGLADLKEQLDIKELLLKRRESKLDMREEMLN